MPNPRLTAIITALLYLTVPGSANAQFSLAQLQDIERYIVASDCGGLLGYLLENPDIMDGADPLATELRSFADGVGTGLIQCLSAAPGLSGQGFGTGAAVAY